ncbi:unnamed protein product, partial [Chrysoparadoxa australica]
VAKKLHCILPLLNEADEASLKLQVAISSLCEKWWLGDRDGAKELVTCLLPWLLGAALRDDGSAADVRRVYAMRNALLELDFDGMGSGAPHTAYLMPNAFLDPTFLGCAEGRGVLAFVFRLSPGLTRDIHSTVKTRMEAANENGMKVYGKIYFEAWENGQDKPACRQALDYAVRDLMHSCVSTASPVLHENLLVLLKVFHDKKKVALVDALLRKVYDPFLWYALKDTNPAVRKQA